MKHQAILAHGEQMLHAFGMLLVLGGIVVAGIILQGARSRKARITGIVLWVLAAALVGISLLYYARHPERNSPF